uniref:Holin n=1 Tax=viral metagenome TaxID=1070528 RepID=A0A6M3LEK5_9ZZZZ
MFDLRSIVKDALAVLGAAFISVLPVIYGLAAVVGAELSAAGAAILAAVSAAASAVLKAGYETVRQYRG